VPKSLCSNSQADNKKAVFLDTAFFVVF